ncbi:hypothetical protein LCGC14_2071590, partial [marine sediment metagenome]
IEEQLEGGSRQWREVGRCALYGVVDNYLRSPRIKAEEDPDNDDDPGYTEWPIIPPSSLATLEDLEGDAHDIRTVSCERIQDVTGCGGVADPCTLADATSTTIFEGSTTFFKTLPCVFDRNSDRDTFLANNFAESRYNQEPSKLGPNYTAKGVRRGWVFKDILRHSSGSFDSASRPILAVYNRSLGSEPIINEGSIIRSNFQQSQSPGAGANALAYDVAVSWPWIGSSTGDSGYDYRTVWPGKTDAYAPSGQAIELKQRGQFEWDDDQCFGFKEESGDPPVILDVSQIRLTALGACWTGPPACGPGYVGDSEQGNFISYDHVPTPAEACALAPNSPRPGWPCPCSIASIRAKVYFGTLGATRCGGGGADYWTRIPTDGVTYLECPACPCCPRTIPLGQDPGFTNYWWYVPNSTCPDTGEHIDCDATLQEILDNPNIGDAGLGRLGDPPDPTVCNPIIWFEVSENAKNIYSRARAFGMGVNNAGGLFTARLPGSETTWNPSQNQFKVRREIILNDYGVNEGLELLNLAQSYLTLPGKELGGFTTLKMWLAGIPRAGGTAPNPNKIIQTGDRLQIGVGLPHIATGAWIVDSAEYEFPEGTLTLLLSQKPAAQARPLVRGNIRSIGESLAAVGGVYESPWFHATDTAFLIDPARADPTAFYDTFAFEHFIGVSPRTITMVAAKSKIFDWYDDDLVIAAQP